jgi:iron complex outermembrane receptor protein
MTFSSLGYRAPVPAPKGAGFAPRLLALAAAMSAIGAASAQTLLAAAPESVVITATRNEARAFDIPASIDRVGSEDIRAGRAQVNISESLGAVPGLLARDRQNYAQDVQISVRGFGARSTFGIRGVRLYVDGIPATLPDGQGQISNVELGTVDRIEVLRGPYSALYGNSSGGVVQVFTEEGSGTPHASVSLAGGSDSAARASVQAGGRVGAFSYTAGASRFRTDGYRDHSTTLRYLGNAKFNWRPDDDSKVTLVVNSVALPQAEDPLGLSRAQFEANPRGVDPSALTFNTRKTVNQSQAGLVYERRIDAGNSLQLMAYGGHRNTEQFQSIAVATQANALHPGGLISLGRDYRGGDVRWSLKSTSMPLSVVAGFAYDTLKERRRGYQNFVGSVLGVKGALRRDENNEVTSTDPYVQASYAITQQLSVNAGVRSSRVSFKSTDNYVVGTNPNDSGSAKYSGTLPAFGVMFAATEGLHLYATAGKGFETPTLNELAYRANGATGMNFGLQSASSKSLEVGLKVRPAGLGEWTAAVFQTDTEHEIVTQTNSGGRSTFQNAGATQRKGLELSGNYRAFDHLRMQLAYTLLDATYRDAFLTCTATPCAAANVNVAAGNKIPGIARSAAYASLGWAPPQGLRAALEVRSLSKVYVNDLNSDAAPASTIASASVGYVVNAGPIEFNAFVRMDNLTNRSYVGSVIVNEGNSRFFEPAPGRTWLASVSASASF